MNQESQLVLCASCQEPCGSKVLPGLISPVGRVVDYARKTFSASGFPNGGTVFVEGFKFKDIPPIEVAVCESCVTKEVHKYENVRAKEFAMARVVYKCFFVISILCIL